METDNYRKHTHKNPVQQYLIGKFYETFFSLAQTLDASSILDVGCGEGFTLAKLQEEKIGNQLEGVDYLGEAIKIGKKLYPKLKLKQGTIFDLPYGDDSFDLVICTEVLEHLENPGRALQELRRVSKTYILLSVPHEPFFMISNLLRGKNLARLGNDIEHINHWSSRGFEKFIKRGGFSIVEKKNPFPWTMILAKKKSQKK